MALTGFRVLPDTQQSKSEYVVVLADDGKIRVITHVTRTAIEDCVRGNPPQTERRLIIERNIAAVSRLIAKKYQSGIYQVYTDSLGITDKNNKLIVIETGELKLCNLR